MSIPVPKTQTLIDNNIARIEGQLNQTTPSNDKAFNKVLATMEGMNDAQLYRFAIEQAAKNLAITANLEGLKILGQEYDVPYNNAEAAVLTITIPGINGTIVPLGTDFVGIPNGELYFSQSAATVAGGIATINIQADQLGVNGNLEVSDTLIIGTQIAGLESTGTVTVIVNLGVEDEATQTYRIRILDKIRSPGGGGNAADYRNWSQEVAGVARAYPYSGLPYGSSLVSTTADRTVYIEAETSIDPDGIAPGVLLDSVRDSITTDPDTGIARQLLGLTNDTLYVESITRLSAFLEIRNLVVEAAIEAQVKSDISDAVDLYLRFIAPFIPGIDPEDERTDTINNPILSSIVNDVVSAAGGTVEAVTFGLSFGSTIPTYTLNPGELIKNGGITYVTI